MTSQNGSTEWYGRGRRKSAVARVWLNKDAAVRTVNNTPVNEYFTTIAQQQAAVRPLEDASLGETVGFTVRVAGGGKIAQADAVQLGLARAIVSKEDSFRKQLKDAGHLTRDARVKERKKFGLKRARRAPQFSKR